MCQCKNVEIGSHEVSVMISEKISVDKCIAEEILGLWEKGITTTGSCCGHNKINGMINFPDSETENMKQLGYRVYRNKFGAMVADSKTCKIKNR